MAQVPTVKMRVLRSFYMSKNDPKMKDSIVDIPVTIARTLVTDGKAEYVRDMPKAAAPAASAAQPEPITKKTEQAGKAAKEK